MIFLSFFIEGGIFTPENLIGGEKMGEGDGGTEDPISPHLLVVTEEQFREVIHDVAEELRTERVQWRRPPTTPAA